jgi:osmotically inducible protein OsmC
MALSHGLAQAGNAPTSIDTTADVTFQAGEGITGIKLTVKGVVPGLSSLQFEEAAQDAKKNCPVSQALTGTTITLEASLVEA